MSALINKIWLFAPNEYTTIFKLTVLFTDGSESVYEYHKSGTSWVSSGAHDGKLIITLPDEDSSAFRVRAYKDTPFISMRSVYANSAHSKEMPSIDLKRIIFDRGFDGSHPYYDAWTLVNNNPWNGFPDEMPDIFLTNLTEYVTLPSPTIWNGVTTESVDSKWYGWGVLNNTYSVRAADYYRGNPSWSSRYMPVSTIITRNYSALPEIPLQSDMPLNPTDKNTIIGQRDIASMPTLGNCYRFLPIYNGGSYWNYSQHLDEVADIHKINVTAGTGGAVTVSGETGMVYDGWEVPDGGDVVLTAMPDEGYAFTQWSDGVTDNPRIVENITDNLALTAEFSAE